MGREIEIEFKNLVSSEDFTKLLNHFQISSHDFTMQENHYFDSLDFSLKQKRTALRVREISDQFELTLKKAIPIGHLEINQVLSPKEAKSLLAGDAFPPGEVKDELDAMDVPHEFLILFGSLKTKRAELAFKGGRLMFDHSTYLGTEDFEIEYEVSEDHLDQSKVEFYNLLNGLNIPFLKADNKIKRFFIARNSIDMEGLD